MNFVSHLKENINTIDEFSKNAREAKEEISLNSSVETDSVASSAVCFHTYHYLQDNDFEFPNDKLIVGAEGKCFRYESKNMKTLERLRDFTMREVICLGTSKEVLSFRKQTLEITKKFLIDSGLNFKITTANDPFFIEEFGMQTIFQRKFNLKYEFNVFIPSNKSYLAIGSSNYHTDFLGKSFNIRNKGEIVHSSCLAFGLERCVYAFLSQYGTDKSNWPEFVLKNLQYL